MCLPEVDDDHWLSNLEASGWLKHIKMVIAGAVKIVDKVNFFSSVTVLLSVDTEALCHTGLCHIKLWTLS